MAGSGQRRLQGGGRRTQRGGRYVVVVESPAKAKTIRAWLGPPYRVMATRGHVRDLPAKAGSVDPGDGFSMVYETGKAAARTLGAIARALENAEGLILATDPDREGEAIAWQVLDWLTERDAIGGRRVERATFHEVTEEAVRAALDNPRGIDMDLVRAWQARRALDYLVGYSLSPVLWRKLPGCRSAGRVQSVALRLTIAALDGYVAALIVCPEMIPPSEWLPEVWGGEHEFGDVAEAEATIAAVMEHYNRIARELAEHPEDYAPVLEIDPNGGETLWEPWTDGFERAMRLRPDAWEEIALSDDEEASASISMIVALNDFYYGRSELTEEAEDEFDRMAPGLIPEFVRNLNAWTKSRQIGKSESGDTGYQARFDRDDPPAFGRKVGRNEPCPCGSGRKYKRCCGAH